jgi:hypothetical protein
MRRPRTLPAFSKDEFGKAHALLAARVAFMMGRKFEEGDWADVYCQAKAIPNKGWSNLNIDVMHSGLGVEHKMLRRESDSHMKDVCGTRLMHPAATRSIRIPVTDDASEAMKVILLQYASLISERRDRVRADAGGHEPDMRTGWLLWQSTLKEFLYFEEEMLAPDPIDYFAEWRDSGGGSRKGSRNLWIFERETGQKRYSVTTVAGAKIQPYFDVPPPTDPNLYLFRVQGEEVERGLIRVWVALSTHRELLRLLGDLSTESLSNAIAVAATEPEDGSGAAPPQEEAVPLLITPEAYELLTASFAGVSDEHMMQLLADRIRRTNGQ